MISKTFNRYIWLLNILLQRKKLTLEEICEEWNKSYLGDNTPLSKRTFHQHRNAIEELFDVSIICDTSNGFSTLSSTSRSSILPVSSKIK